MKKMEQMIQMMVVVVVMGQWYLNHQVLKFMKIFKTFLCLILLTFKVNGQIEIKKSNGELLKNERQLTRSWCWAASTIMALKFNGNDSLDQCKVIEKWNQGKDCDCSRDVFFNTNNCDRSDFDSSKCARKLFGTPSMDDKKQDIAQYSNMYTIDSLLKQFGVSNNIITKNIDSVKNAIKVNKVVLAYSVLQLGHIVVIRGLDENKNLFHLNDPYSYRRKTFLKKPYCTEIEPWIEINTSANYTRALKYKYKWMPEKYDLRWFLIVNN